MEWIQCINKLVHFVQNLLGQALRRSDINHSFKTLFFVPTTSLKLWDHINKGFDKLISRYLVQGATLLAEWWFPAAYRDSMYKLGPDNFKASPKFNISNEVLITIYQFTKPNCVNVSLKYIWRWCITIGVTICMGRSIVLSFSKHNLSGSGFL
jgi:hypothetical protein